VTGASRALRADVRNPALLLPSLRILGELPDDTPWWVAREHLLSALREFEGQNRENAERSLRRKKAFMYAYWYGWAVYARHFRRALQVFTRRPPEAK
jgi:hypothetical protein